ncbi:MAG: hypothetical protein KIS67_04550 [Verrucomicrobiae bacterium]|nr:hypothetical protein [Verrucomicrobiae bacterium]
MLCLLGAGFAQSAALDLAGLTLTPHVQSTELRYRREPDFSLGARVELFLRHAGREELRLSPDAAIRLRGKSPEALLAAGEWTWHDFPSAWTNQPLVLPPGALTVWTFNGKRAPWGVGTSATLAVPGAELKFDLAEPRTWLSAVTFLGDPTNPVPDALIFHVVNRTAGPLRVEACRLWLPENNVSWRALRPQAWFTNLNTFPADAVIPAGERGGARIQTGPLPLTYTAVEVRVRDAANEPLTLWAHLRIKREVFDISGGWVSGDVRGRSSLTFEPFLKTLRRMHVNTAHIGPVGGYTDNPELYAEYPLKYFNRLTPFEQFDREDVLPRIHAVEFLGEPQYGGGRPVPPQEVWQALAPYAATRLPTTVTHSEERIWRDYAGLSDYPHYDAYRVSAPAADAWARYDRWDGQTIRWGAPLETIGDLTISLRELNRPRPVAYWSQGAHHGWDRYGGRARTSPTPEELRAQAYHALAHRVTSLYWFNLSWKSLLKFPDLIEPITRVGREMRVLEDYYLEGDAYHFERRRREGKPDWDVAVITGPRGAVCFALDLAYSPDARERVFKFGPPRQATFAFPLPAYLRDALEVVRVEAEGVRPVNFTTTAAGIEVSGRSGPENVFVVSLRAGVAAELQARLRELVAYENSFGFDPGNQPEDLEQLQRLLNP